jgi:stearoyl-CoA desaturase (delta-9 desaturase)
MHASCLLVFWVGASTADLVLLAATFYARMFGITGGYHRYFAHKTYKTSRAFQFVLAFLACSATQKGPLWWAGHHRGHHKYAEGRGSPLAARLYHAHRAGCSRAQDGTPLDRIAISRATPSSCG